MVVKHTNISPAFPYQEILLEDDIIGTVRRRGLIKLLVAPGDRSRGSAGPSTVLWLQDIGRQSLRMEEINMSVYLSPIHSTASTLQQLGSSALLLETPLVVDPLTLLIST